MTVHGNVELLSSFVDDELESPEREAVESHLAECRPCRERLVGLRRVVTELQDHLAVVAPPAGLSGHVRRAVLLDGDRGGVLRRNADSLLRWTQQPLLLPLFGVITALAVLLYLFTAWSDHLEQPGTRLIVTPEAAATAATEGDTLRLAGRIFDRASDRWVERGVDPDLAGEPIDLSRPDPAHTALEPFRRLGGRVILLDGGRPVAVDFGDP